MFSNPIRFYSTSVRPPFNIHTNPYRAKRLWPPDFTKLSPKHQFRLERRYRRRAKLKWARPRWTKAVKLAQLGSVIFVLTYGVLYMDWGSVHTPFKGIREWYRTQVDPIWSSSSSQPSRPSLRDTTPENSPTTQSQR